MKLHTKIALGLISALFAASIATAADRGTKMHRYNQEMYCNGMGIVPGDMWTDPVARSDKHLSEMKAKLNLTKDQEPAWKTFSDQVNDQAKSMKSVHDKFRADTQTTLKTAPERMARMADMMKDRAQDMARMADVVKTFYATLTPEQQATFDKIHMNRMWRKGNVK